MSIVSLRKLTLFGLAGEKKRILEQVQQLGCLHLVSLKPARIDVEKPPPTLPQEVYSALRYLERVPDRRRQVKRSEDFDLQRVVEAVLDNQRRLRALEDRIVELADRIEALKPWGNFILPPDEDLAGQKLWFYILPRQVMKGLRTRNLPWQVVHQDNQFAYVVVICPEEPPANALPGARTHTGSDSLQQVIENWEACQIEYEEVRAERVALTRWSYLIGSHLNAAEDLDARQQAATGTFDDDALFALQGWIPAPELGRLRDFAEEHDLALLLEHPGIDEKPPTLLDNPPTLAAGQDLVGFYQTPGYRAWDPSQVVFLSFTLFFAMILSDAGYAALLGLALLAGWRRMGRSDTGRRLRTLAAALCGSALLWGVAVGSYFGITPPQHSWVYSLKLLDIQDFDVMMRLSVSIGVLHIALANAVMAWNQRGRNRALMHLGWIGVACGGLLYWFGMDGYTLLDWSGRGLAGTGLLLVFAFGSERPLNTPRDGLLRLLEGLFSLTNITKIFGDVLSYLRLFALGLASASLALTFNDLAQQVAAANPGIGVLFSLLILFVGHALNILLSLMSGVVHGLRLNFIEFYNWGLSEEGYPFRAFAKKGENP
jgi:V/A-type H+-transporting ATPase subunit I